MNNMNRRTFRGRSGPTDRNLPRHQARRRKTGTTTPSSSHQPPLEGDAVEGRSVSAPLIEETIVVDGGLFQISCNPTEKEMESVDSEGKDEDQSPSESEDAVETQAMKEIRHLNRRIQNNRRALTQSSSLSNLVAYKANVLNATSNCVVEWKAILNRYLGLPEATLKSTSLGVFELIQHSLQTGPLKGSTPGYFKRCGGETASIVLAFLQSIFPNEQVGEDLHFSDKQVKILAKWTENAKTATLNNKPPSKSVLKKEALALKNHSKKKKLQNKA